MRKPMRKKATAVIFVMVVLVATVVASLLQVYSLREDSAGDVLWNSNEAYLFIDIAYRGTQLSYLKYLWMAFREHFGGVAVFTNERRSVTVLHISASGIEQHSVDVPAAPPGIWPGEYTPLDDRIYANCPAIGGLCRWAGDHFEPATAEEHQRFDGISRLTTVDILNASGWSKHAIASGPEGLFARSTTNVDGQFTILEKSEPIDHSGYAAFSIYVQRPGQPTTRIWYLDGRPKRVREGEYKRTFGAY
jgi:hypothetical protein